jgi:tetratricopeptide (TPR) repeat protein
VCGVTTSRPSEPDDETLDLELDRLFTARDRDHMSPTIDALTALQERHPGHARVLYELAGAYDTAGREAAALPWYEQAMTAGLTGDVLRRCYLQYGSTLRHLDRLQESLEVFRRARSEFPDSVALRVFEALTLHAADRSSAAISSLIGLIADHVHSDDIDRYKPAMRANANHLESC